MPSHSELHEKRLARRTTLTEVHSVRSALGQARRGLELAERASDREAVERAKRDIRTLSDREARLARQLEGHRATIDRLREAVLEGGEAEIARLAGDLPIALLPVRLETHFAIDGDRVSELRIRIYPDDIHVDSHEPELTDLEVKEGQRYWERIWRAGPDTERRRAAWRELAERQGEERAGWLIQETRPTNEAPELEEPVALDTPLPVQPQFPKPRLKQGDWSRAPQAAVLPDRWTALGFRNNTPVFSVSGRQIPEELAIGPDPSVEPSEGESLFIDEPSRWTIDFDAAETVGMGVRVHADTAMDLDAGLDLLLVVGVKSSAGPDEGAEALTQLFVAQHHTEGLAFLRRGVPTNNSEPERSGWEDRTAPKLSSTAPEASPIHPGSGSAAGGWAKVLGLSAEQAVRAFGTVEGASQRDEESARAMNAALWPATWGYLLEHMAGDGPRSHIATIRTHVLDYLRPGGHHASLRVRNQPYGLIIQTDLDSLRSDGEGTEDKLLDLVLRLRDEFWKPGIGRAPKMGRTADPDRDLVEILGQQAVSSSYAVRPAMGSAFIANLRALFETPAESPWWTNHQQNARAALESLGLEFEAGILHLGYFTQASEEIPTLVQEGAPAPGQLLEPNYIEWLRESGHRRILREEFAEEAPATLLYRLLRQSALQETARESIVHLSARQPELASMRLENELVDLVPASPAETIAGIQPGLTPTLVRVLDVPVAGVTDGFGIGEYLSARRDSDEPPLARFREFWDALDHLKTLPIDRLELLLRETLDASSHRLDVWLSSFAARLLASRRETDAGNVGVHVGGYGFVEDLRPRRIRRSDGFVHTPSVRHAGLAAVLRSAHLSHREVANSSSFSVDLSSERVRLASWLLDGVRQGQPLGELLGYRFERGLHERHAGVELDVFIHALRRRAPLVSLEEVTEPLEAVAARNVVDGLALVRLWERDALDFESDDELPNPGSAEHKAIVSELEGLQAVIDAVGDSLLAESVFQIGNPSRTAATLDSVASGEIPPPELQFARTPRHGLGIVHRVVVALPAEVPPPVDWLTDSRQVRAHLDPALNAWAGALLGSPNRYRYHVRYVRPGDDAVLGEELRSLGNLRISPLDVVFLVENETPDTAVELLDLARHEATLNRPGGISPEARVEVTFEVADDPITLRDLFEVARAVRQVLQRVRPLDGLQLTALGENGTWGVELAELETRVGGVVTEFLQLEARLLEFLDDPLASPLDPLRDTLLALHSFGLRGTIPRSPAGLGAAERESLVQQARAIRQEVESRRGKIAEEDDEFVAASADTSARIAHARNRASAMMGGSICALPRFTAANASELTQSLAQRDALTNGDALAPATWLQRNARVRDRVANFHDVLMYDGALNARDPYTLEVAQLPFKANARWAALPQDPANSLEANRLSLLLFAPFGLEPANSLMGFVVDEWSETVPNDTETTAIAFHYDQPGARAPNALLLAVAPDSAAPWNLASLEKIVRDTLELAKLRCVDGEALTGLGQFLPALLFATNSEGGTIDARLDRLVGASAIARED